MEKAPFIHSLPTYQSEGLALFMRSLAEFFAQTEYRVLVFGSYCHGSAQHWSDLDIAVISDDFQGLPWRERVARLELIVPRNGCLIKPIGFTLHEFRNFSYPQILQPLRENHIRIH